MVSVLVVAHCPAVGVKVYVVVVVLFRAGDHVPVIPFIEVVGNALNAAPLQIAGTGRKLGVMVVFTTMVIVAGPAQTPVFGVKV